MRTLPRRALLAAPAAVLMFALAACGGGSDSGADSGSSKSDTQQAAQGAGDTAGDTGDTDDKKEPPLTGDIKQKAEAAAIAAHPGTVIKSEEDAEKPGMYAVEVKKEDGTTVEVYLDKSFKVSGTKQEGTEETENDG
ncbi:peptidase [Streptomyces olivochromogenes]|uniref:peptidase n=1 Tax=Streptomyces olivochromogenes TaxID=1963 RepID=UPI001F209E57|nr:peptidase [Streptomyces olivochromogenes]MCF3134476.1 peptidase [Streptomyces olivochromogenes]